MVAKKRREFDVKSWAKKSGSNSNLCQTCSRHPDAAEAVKALLTMIVSGEVVLSLSKIHRMLQRELDYTLGPSAFHNHVRNCEAELWSQIKR